MPRGGSFAYWPVFDLGPCMHNNDCAQKPRPGNHCVQHVSVHGDLSCCTKAAV